MNLSIPMIRRVLPALMAQELVSVQPMTGKVGEIFAFKEVTEPFENPQQGELRHSFHEGWQRYYGTQWIPAWLWMHIKLKGL